MSTSTQPHFSDRGHDDQEIRHAKNDAPSERQFEELYQASHALTDYYSSQARFALIASGRLGMRPGEVAHFDSEWVDWSKSRIEIPAHDRCRKGRDGDTICGYCERLAKSRAAHTPVSIETARDQRWHPKTQAGVREIPIDFSERVSLVVEQFCDRFESWPLCRQSVNRRIDRLAEATDGITELYPHALRAHSGSYHASRGVGALALKAMHGWSLLSTANVYLSESPDRTQRAVRAAHSR